MIKTVGGGWETLRQSERQEGFQTGKIQASHEIAVRMLRDGFDRNAVSRRTKLRAEQTDWLTNEQNSSN